MNSKQEIRKGLRELSQHQDILDEMEKADPDIKAKIAGVIMSTWLPYGWFRRFVMFVLLAICILGGLFVDVKFFLLVFLIAFFSPRIVGEVAIFIGYLKQAQRN